MAYNAGVSTVPQFAQLVGTVLVCQRRVVDVPVTMETTVECDGQAVAESGGG